MPTTLSSQSIYLTVIMEEILMTRAARFYLSSILHFEWDNIKKVGMVTFFCAVNIIIKITWFITLVMVIA